MSFLNQMHYHCLIDPTDGTIISEGETSMKECSPLDFAHRLIDQWGKAQLASMQDHETRTLDYFYATNLIRPHRSIGTFTKGPFVAVRRVTGSSDPGHESHFEYQSGFEGAQPALYGEFPLPKIPPAYLAKEHFYDPDVIKSALADCLKELKTAASSNFAPESITQLISKAKLLVTSTGGQDLIPHPQPFSRPNEEENAILMLDLVIFAILEASPDSLPPEAVQDYRERQDHLSPPEYKLRHLLASLKSDTTFI